MQFPGFPFVPLAQAAAQAEVPWYREPFGQAIVVLAAIAGPTLLAWTLAKRLRAADMWGRIAAVLVAATCGGLVIWSHWPLNKHCRLGIDLKGGLILVYEVDAAKEAARSREAGDAAQPADMDKLVTAVSRRVNPGGQKEVTVRRYGLDQIEVIVPDVDQAEVDLIKRIVSSGGALEFRIVANPRDARHEDAIEAAQAAAGATVRLGGRALARWVELDPVKVRPDSGLVTRAAADGRAEVLVMLDDENVTGEDLSRCGPGFDQSLQPCVKFNFKARGADRFGTLTSDNLPDPANRLESRLGIVLDGVLQSAPVIRETISANGQITGNFKQEDVDVLVEVLNAGSLPAALVHEPISEQKISSQLGADTIKSGARAMALATVVVLLFMLAYYRFSGLVADLAVLLNIVLVLAVMISIKAAFTLAGLAGLVLSVGMAVDANVLIYERMREEADRGAAVRMAIRNGFSRAFSTILDSNLTTVITGVVLFAIGTDQLKGFAVTLILGLVLNLFTAVYCSRVVFDLAERNGWLRRLNMARIFGQPAFRFVAWMPVAMAVSMIVILAGAAAAWVRGPGLLDIDFTGGSSVQLEFLEGQGLGAAEVRRLVGRDGAGLPDVAVSAMSAGTDAADRGYKIDTSDHDLAQVQRRIGKAFAGRLPTYAMKIESVTGPTEPAAEAPAAQEGGAPAAAPRTVARIEFPDRISLPTLQEQLARALAAKGHPAAAVELVADGMTARAKPYDKWTLTTPLDPAAIREVLEAVRAELADEPVFRSANTIGGKVAGNTKVTALVALTASLVLIVLYVWVRFQNVAFGLAAVVALIHDVLVAVACLALSKFVAPWLGWALVDDFKISLDVVAALLTIIGFSINDTIVIFDRLRELRGKGRYVTADMVDRAVNQTLSRTILTSGTALLATLILYAFGGQGIHAFAFTMLVGIVTGSYSTIYIASPIVLWLQRRGAGAAAHARGAVPA